MIKAISARGLKFIPELDLEFEPGLNVITGETGAGKTVFIKAILAAFGLKSLRDELSDSGGFIEVVLLNSDVEEGQTIIRREMTAEGRLQSYLNGLSTNQAEIKELTSGKLVIHSQNQTVRLLNRSFQLKLYDSQNIELAALVADYQKIRSEALRLKKEFEEALIRDFELKQKISSIKDAIEQLEELGPKAGEEIELKQRRDIIKNYFQISESLSKAAAFLSLDEESALYKIGQAIQALRIIEGRFAGIESYLKSLEQLQENLNEISLDISKYLAEFDAENMDIDGIESRLYKYQTLKKKLNLDPDIDLASYLEQLKKEFVKLQQKTKNTDMLERQFKVKYRDLEKLADEISKKRNELKKSFERKVNLILKDLNIGDNRFRVSINRIRENNGKYPLLELPVGYDEVVFEFALNQNEFTPITRAASGGELSRLMLALETLENEESGNIYIFDEIDTGIGGRTAVKLGEYLSKLSSNNQVIVITHLPQVAAFAGAHYYIEKIETEKGPTIKIKPLKSRQERIREIARMLSGDLAGKNAIEYAERLLEEAEARKE